MARIRSVHSEQWTDDQFVTCSPLARLLALGVRNYADDNGIFEWNPIKLKMRILPADNCDVEALLGEMLETDQVHQFEINGKKYGIIRSFNRYQKPKKPTYSYPVPEVVPNGYEIKSDEFGTSGEPMENQFGKSNSEGEERRGEKGRGEKGRKGACPFSEQVPEDWLKETIDKHGSVLDWSVEGEKFINRALAKNEKYADWKRAWWTWCRNAIDFARKDGRLKSAKDISDLDIGVI